MNVIKETTTFEEVSGELRLSDSSLMETISMGVDRKEMLLITPEGFFVQGVKVELNEADPETYKDIFRAFLMWMKGNGILPKSAESLAVTPQILRGPSRYVIAKKGQT